MVGGDVCRGLWCASWAPECRALLVGVRAHTLTFSPRLAQLTPPEETAIGYYLSALDRPLNYKAPPPIPVQKAVCVWSAVMVWQVDVGGQRMGNRMGDGGCSFLLPLDNNRVALMSVHGQIVAQPDNNNNNNLSNNHDDVDRPARVLAPEQ